MSFSLNTLQLLRTILANQNFTGRGDTPSADLRAIADAFDELDEAITLAQITADLEHVAVEPN